MAEDGINPEYADFHPEKIAELQKMDLQIKEMFELLKQGRGVSDFLLEHLIARRKDLMAKQWIPYADRPPPPPPVIWKPRRWRTPTPTPPSSDIDEEEEPVIIELPQIEPLPGQMKNDAGGYSYEVCDMVKLKRFIVIGSENGSYYATPTETARYHIATVAKLIEQGHGKEIVNVLKTFSEMGRCAKDDVIITCLMQCAMCNQSDVQQAAYAAVPIICNIPTKLFLFLDMCQLVINGNRQFNPPPAQPDKKRKRIHTSMNDLNINAQDELKVGEKKKLAEDEELQPKKKKKKTKKKKIKPKDIKEPGFKKVNRLPRKSSGWGRLRRRGISNWYTDCNKDHNRLLYLLTKYKQRHNWSHKQVLNYAHPRVPSNDEFKFEKNLVFTYCTRGFEKANIKIEKEKERCQREEHCFTQSFSEIVQNINSLETVSKLSKEREGDEGKLIEILHNLGGKRAHRHDNIGLHCVKKKSTEEIEQKKSEGRREPFQIVREHIPTVFFKSVKVWEAMLEDMPMTAMIRNLGKMSTMDMFADDNGKNVKNVTDALTNIKRLKSAKVHPMKILIAMKVYEQGHGEKSDLQWTVSAPIVKALNESFHKSFQSAEVNHNFKTGKKFMLNLDVSSSMTFRGCFGCNLITPAMASVAMALVTWNVEDNCKVMAFGYRLENIEKVLRKDMTLTEAMEQIEKINFGSTNCALPMTYAMDNKLDVDIFIIYTDSDTSCGFRHPPATLRRYNCCMKKPQDKPNARVIVCAMEANRFSIADPNNPDMMDMCGFDVNSPDIIAEFAKGNMAESCNICDTCKENNAHMEVI